MCSDITVLYGINCFKNRKKEEKNMIPNDPVMLLSFANLKLRDYYTDLEQFCEDLDIAKTELEEKLAGIDYHYDREKNQFV